MDVIETWNFYQGLAIMSDIVSSVVKQSEATVAAQHAAIAAVKSLTSEIASLNKSVSGASANFSNADFAELDKVVTDLNTSTLALVAAIGTTPPAAPTLGHGLILADIRADAKDVVAEAKKVLPIAFYYAAIAVGGSLLFLAGALSHVYFFCQ